MQTSHAAAKTVRHQVIVINSRASTDIDHLQEESSQTEETGRTSAGELVGGTLEGRCGGGRLGCNDGADSGGTSWHRRGSRGSGLCRLGSRGDGGGEGDDAGRGERTLGDGDGLSWSGGVGADGGGLGDGDGLAGGGRGVGDDA